MEIVKQNENFILTDSTESFEINGTINKDTLGTLNINFNINEKGGNYLGNCYYNTYIENGNISFGLNCNEENRDALTSYTDTIIDSVLAYFNNAL